MHILTKFKEVGNNVFSIFKNKHYTSYDFQELLLKINKSVRGVVFKYNGRKYDSYLDTNNIQLQDNLFVNIVFTNTKGSVTYEFINHEKKELLTVYTNGQKHDFLMEGIKVLDKSQIQEVYELLDLPKNLLLLQKICQEKNLEKKKVIKDKPNLTPSYIKNTNFFDVDNKQFIEQKINNLKDNLQVSLKQKFKM